MEIDDYHLPLLDEPVDAGAANRNYERESTRVWSRLIDGFDGFVWVTPEYNHGVPAAMKNAVDLLYPEWNNKAAGFVGYGFDGATRAVEQWRSILASVVMFTVRAQVALLELRGLDRRRVHAGRAAPSIARARSRPGRCDDARRFGSCATEALAAARCSLRKWNMF